MLFIKEQPSHFYGAVFLFGTLPYFCNPNNFSDPIESIIWEEYLK